MNSIAPDTRARIVDAAARLFRQRGYHAVGLNEILAESRAPKGSLYHHFPEGKPDLARAAAEREAGRMLDLIRAAFATSTDFMGGVEALCTSLADRFDASGQAEGCPITAILLYGPEEDAYRRYAKGLYISWGELFTRLAVQKGLAPEKADRLGCVLQYGLQGAWAMALASASSAPLRDLPNALGLATYVDAPSKAGTADELLSNLRATEVGKV